MVHLLFLSSCLWLPQMSTHGLMCGIPGRDTRHKAHLTDSEESCWYLWGQNWACRLWSTISIHQYAVQTTQPHWKHMCGQHTAVSIIHTKSILPAEHLRPNIQLSSSITARQGMVSLPLGWMGDTSCLYSAHIACSFLSHLAGFVPHRTCKKHLTSPKIQLTWRWYKSLFNFSPSIPENRIKFGLNGQSSRGN